MKKYNLAMKCNKKQFESIMPKLKGIRIFSVTDFKEYPYLINFDNGSCVSNIDSVVFRHKLKDAKEIQASASAFRTALSALRTAAAGATGYASAALSQIKATAPAADAKKTK